MEIKIILKGDNDGEFAGLERSFSGNRMTFANVLEELVRLCLEIDFEHPWNQYQKAMLETSQEYLEGEKNSFVLKMEPAEHVLSKTSE